MKVKFSVSTGYVGSQREEIVEFEDSLFEGKTEKEIDEIISEDFEIWLGEQLDAGWSIEED